MKAQDLIDQAELHKLNNELSESIELWQQVVDKYPGTDQSAYAVDQLKKHPSSNSNENSNKSSGGLKSILLIIFGIYIASQIGGYLGKGAAENASSSSKQNTTEIKPVLVLTTVQDAEGGSESDFNQTGLKALEKWTLDTMLKKGKSNYAEQGYNPKDFNPKFTAKSLYLVAGGKKFAIIKVNANNAIRSVTILGFKGKEQVTVNCIRASNHDIPIWSGNCGNEVNKTFGVKFEQ